MRLRPYGTHLNPARLSQQQLAEVSAIAEADRPADRDVWFVLVHTNDDFAGGLHYAATIYYTPDKISPRLRAGRCSGGSSLLRSPEGRRKLRELLGSPEGILSEYVQVSAAAEPFGKELPIPSGSLFPFGRPPGLSDEDLIHIIDAAREVHDAKGWSYTQEPICRIETDGRTGGDLRVMFGWQDAPLAGGGTFVDVHKTPTGYKADGELGRWVS